jgi:hypothetical protein
MRQALADIEVLARLEIEGRGLTPAPFLPVGALVGAVGDVVGRQVRDG